MKLTVNLTYFISGVFLAPPHLSEFVSEAKGSFIDAAKTRPLQAVAAEVVQRQRPERTGVYMFSSSRH